jgi:hypothetical protein
VPLKLVVLGAGLWLLPWWTALLVNFLAAPALTGVITGWLRVRLGIERCTQVFIGFALVLLFIVLAINTL